MAQEKTDGETDIESPAFPVDQVSLLHWSLITASTQLITQNGIVSTRRPAEIALELGQRWSIGELMTAVKSY